MYEAAQQHYDFKAKEDFDSPSRILALEFVMSTARDMENSRRATKQSKKDVKNAEVALEEAQKEAVRKEVAIRRQIARAEARVNLVEKKAPAIHAYFEEMEDDVEVVEVFETLLV